MLFLLTPFFLINNFQSTQPDDKQHMNTHQLLLYDQNDLLNNILYLEPNEGIKSQTTCSRRLCPNMNLNHSRHDKKAVKIAINKLQLNLPV